MLTKNNTQHSGDYKVMLKASDIMTDDVATIRGSATVAEAVNSRVPLPRFPRQGRSLS